MMEPTQEEIDGVAAVFEEVAGDPIARDSAYIMAKKLKRVFHADFSTAVLQVVREAQARGALRM